ncbi:mitochondrial carrier domain-containing protein [Suillus fuscotomentosus]|uniref:Mitochondrial carrier domain-containing protein n=1 Tax=Suillus fuscotomentosus TaxID=1912939 RepID=A0AAD4ELH3_9AGAM|nr:mitochondrial carrier domain-containing protein [Suillus fuscotomentosus]KAG1908392.1 mitochondrial carrier domain-containing protein [Suillus fuscotomentosus]
MSSNPSLRDLYNPPSSAWAFIPPPSPMQNASVPAPAPAATSYQWTTRPAHNSIFDLSPSLDLSEPSSLDVSLLLRSLFASALLQYTSTALVMPLEVGKLLLQIQWIPKDAPAPSSHIYEEEEEEETLSDSTNEDESYFADPAASHTKYPAPKPVDDQGYVIRTSVLEDGTRPEYIIPVGSMNGTWDMVKRVATFRGEGWLSLWKGLLTSCIHDVLFSNVQPLVDNIIHSMFLSSAAGLYRPPLLLPVASHVITGFLLSPLDLVRTRLVAQSAMQRYRTYTGPFDALRQIIAQEGGIRSIYFHPQLLIPTILDNGLRPLLHILMPTLIAPRLGFGPHVAPDTSPIAWAFAQVLGSMASLLITLPIETVRRRLQVQTRGTAKALRTCAETRPVPYNGVVDALWHIVTEERSDLPIKRKSKPRKQQAEHAEENDSNDLLAEKQDESRWLRNTGIGQLYRGMRMRVGVSVIVLLLTTFGGQQEVDGGWAEL